MPLKPHPTDPDKMVYYSRQYDLPQRTWVGLTDEERNEIANVTFGREGALTLYVEAIEAKLKEKNFD